MPVQSKKKTATPVAKPTRKEQLAAVEKKLHGKGDPLRVNKYCRDHLCTVRGVRTAYGAKVYEFSNGFRMAIEQTPYTAYVTKKFDRTDRPYRLKRKD